MGLFAAFVGMFALTMAAPAAEPKAEAEAEPKYYYGVQQNGPHQTYYRGYSSPVDNTTEDRDTISRDTMDSINTTDSTMDSTTDSTTMDSTMDSTTDSTDSKPKAGNYRFTSLSR